MSRPWVLIADPNPARAAQVFDLIVEDFEVQVRCFTSYRGLLDGAEALSRERIVLVILTEDLPEAARPPTTLDGLLLLVREHFFGNNIAVLHFSENPPPLNDSTTEPAWLFFTPDRNGLGTQLAQLLRRFASLPQVTHGVEAALREQIRDLDENRALERGKRILAHLVAQFFPWSQVQVSQLTPGLSGARVFCIGDGGPAQFVLKLAPARDLWKIQQEVARHPLVPAGIPGVRVHKPDLCAVRHDHSERIAAHGNWVAVCYTYLGGAPFGHLLDLRTALIAPAAQLPPDAAADVNAFRQVCLSSLLNWLIGNWYTNRNPRQESLLWRTEDGSDREYPTFPPYQLAGRHKAFVYSFLESEESAILGARCIPGWEQHAARVWNFVSSATLPPLLDRRLPVVLACAHGDLNSRNVFLWVEHLDHPFLIDFPMFQTAGHVLQDFARLEVEIKYQLMDQQHGTAEADLPALAWTWSQLRLWMQLENHVLGPQWESDFSCAAGGCSQNVDLSFQLVRQLRQQARSVQQRPLPSGPGPAEFMGEYRVALLYHTLRAITYSLPVFKRLLAVYAASRLIESLG